MTALEWLKSKFFVNENEDTFWPGQREYSASISVFLACFGDIIETALAEGRNPVNDLCSLPETEKRGWGPDFERWRQQGI